MWTSVGVVYSSVNYSVGVVYSSVNYSVGVVYSSVDKGGIDTTYVVQQQNKIGHDKGNVNGIT